MVNFGYAVRVCLVAAVALLAGCGGGSGGADATGQGNVSVGAGVNSAGITRFSSPGASASIGGQVQGQPGELVLAVNGAGELRAVGILAEAGTVLTYESTAIGLVLLSSTGLTGDASTQSAIRSAPGYPALLQTVQTVMAAGDALSSSALLISQAFAVASEVGSMGAVASSSQFSQPQAVVEPRAGASTYKIIPNEGSLGTVYVVGGLFTGAPKLVNSMPIYWAASATSPAGALLGIGSAGQTELMVKGPTNFERVVSGIPLIGPWIGHRQHDLPTDTSFSLYLRQNSSTRTANVVEISTLIFREFISSYAKTAGTVCEAELAKVLVSPRALAEMAASPSADAYRAWLLSIGRNLTSLGAYASTDVIAACGLEAGALEKAVEFAAGKANWLVEGYKTIDKVVGYATIAEKMYVTANYWGSPGGQAGVCVAQHSLLNYFHNCAASMTAGTVTIVAGAGGASGGLDIRAFDSAGHATGVPVNLEMVSSNNNVARIDSRPSRWTSGAVGTVTIVITDPATDISTSVVIDVVEPLLEALSINLDVGQTRLLRLVDSRGRFLTHAAPTSWGSSDMSIATALGVPCTFGCGVVVAGVNAGQTAVFSNSLLLSVTVNAPGRISSTVSIDTYTSATYSGQELQLTSLVYGPEGVVAMPTGTVTFASDQAVLCKTVIVNYMATCNTALSGPRSYPITASYSGDSAFLPSTSAVFTHPVNAVDSCEGIPTTLYTSVGPPPEGGAEEALTSVSRQCNMVRNGFQIERQETTNVWVGGARMSQITDRTMAPIQRFWASTWVFKSGGTLLSLTKSDSGALPNSQALVQSQFWDPPYHLLRYYSNPHRSCRSESTTDQVVIKELPDVGGVIESGLAGCPTLSDIDGANYHRLSDVITPY